MKILDIKDALAATVIEGADKLETTAEYIYASDLMSDVLAFGQPNSLLLTGLATRQSIISAHMAEFIGVVLVRGKKPKDNSRQFAAEYGLVLMSTSLDMYEACIQIESVRKTLRPVSGAANPLSKKKDIVLCQEFSIEGGNFTDAGMVSTNIKSILKKIGLDPVLTRRVAIATYEGEMNVVMHAQNGKVYLNLTPKSIQIIIEDVGRGIPDVNLAMQKGYSTATEEMRAMGFGSGMGLPNIKKNADKMELSSKVSMGTKLDLQFFIP
jgi:anti-sigma regulatory factor (Ser/Thr protein kinase)